MFFVSSATKIDSTISARNKIDKQTIFSFLQTSSVHTIGSDLISFEFDSKFMSFDAWGLPTLTMRTFK